MRSSPTANTAATVLRQTPVRNGPAPCRSCRRSLPQHEPPRPVRDGSAGQKGVGATTEVCRQARGWRRRAAALVPCLDVLLAGNIDDDARPASGRLPRSWPLSPGLLPQQHASRSSVLLSVSPVRAFAGRFSSAHHLRHQLLCPLLTSDRASRRLTAPVAGYPGTQSDLPGYCAPTFTLMPVGSTWQRSVQVLGFDDFGRLTPLQRLIRFLYVRPALCPQASFRLAVARETLALG